MNIQQTKSSFLKKCFLKFNIFVFLVLFVFSFASCREKPVHINTGEIIDRDAYYSVSKSVEDRVNLDLAGDIENCVFWVQYGSYYHLSRDCHYLSNSKEIYFGNIEDAGNEGKLSVCSACQKKAEKETTSKENKENSPSADTLYYWTENGSVYHSSKECSYIKNSNNIQCGTAEEAILADKTKLCSSCEKRQ